MKRYEAEEQARKRWSVLGSRVGWAWIRRNRTNKYEVGYRGQEGPRRGYVDVIVGRGNNWEEAFAAADRTEGKQ